MNKQIYIGSTNNLKKRLIEHQEGKVISTRRYRPWELLYYEAYISEKIARLREKRLKYNGNASRELKKRIGLVKSGAGFTLLELLIVIFLIGVLTAMVMYAFNSGSHVNDLRRASTELVQGIRQAQQNTIGGNSIWYCTSTPNNNMFGHECQQNVDGPCKVNGDNGACKNGVPQGGYALVLNSTNDYTIFGDTDNNGTYGDPPDYTVVKNYISLKGVHINSFKPYWQTDYLVPGQDNYIVVRFSPPEGTVHFYQKMAGQVQGVEIQDRDLTIIVGSDFLPKTCRKITINHVSGQVSETNLPNCTP